MTALNIVTLLGGLAILVMVFGLLRRQRLQYRYAFVWFGLVLVTAPLAAMPRLLDRTAEWLGVADPPNLLFFAALVVLLGLVALLTAELSDTQDRLQRLAQEHALLAARVDAFEGRATPTGGRDANSSPTDR